MKRYKKLITTIPIWPGGEIKNASKMVEDPQGEWVKWEDVKAVEGQVLESIELKCNCEEMVAHHAYSWICPAHGYKKR